MTENGIRLPQKCGQKIVLIKKKVFDAAINLQFIAENTTSTKTWATICLCSNQFQTITAPTRKITYTMVKKSMYNSF